MKTFKILPLFFFFSAVTHAASSLPLFVSLDAVSMLARPGHTQQVMIWDAMGDTYVTKNAWRNTLTAMPGLGLRAYKNDWLQVNSSLRYLPMYGMNTDGHIWQLNSPQFDNLTYSYEIKSDLFLFDTVFSWARYRFQPGIILGLGYASNVVGNYKESPLNTTTASALSIFSDARTGQFAYEVGAAWDYSFQNVVVEGAYRYINAGQSALGLSPLQNTTDHLSTGNLSYQTFSLGIRLYFNA